MFNHRIGEKYTWTPHHPKTTGSMFLCQIGQTPTLVVFRNLNGSQMKERPG